MSQFVCSSCGFNSASWYGKCPECKEWNTFKEFKPVGKGAKSSGRFGGTSAPATFAPLQTVTTQSSKRHSTGVDECDRVLGGGCIDGEVILIAGEPGIGKSTLLLKMLTHLPTLYISGEESGQQIKQRADRLGAKFDGLHISNDVEIHSILAALETTDLPFDAVVIDSIQTMYASSIDSPIGSPGHIKEVTSRLVEFAKRTGKIIFIVGHVTKEGDIAGPKMLEHLVDCVLYLEGEKHSHFRLLRAYKNRFGPTDEVGIFQMAENGLQEVHNPADLIASASSGEQGKALIVTIEGSRPLFYEIQSLVVPTSLSFPKRVVSGVDFNRLQLLLAVMRKYMNMKLDMYDIYVSVVGGLTAKTPAADLGILMSIYSSVQAKVLPQQTGFIGEIGLAGEVRSVYGQDKVLKDHARFGLKHIYSSKDCPSVRVIKSLLS